ncbi:hypothetical protein D7316_03695 [Gordonia insulae]|uniref:Histidine phosphatase family protein n=2 Tax=Gordonia insulae TaxID=2420509 RepID=A0A3G8JPS6_9ACTN|nr:hypothetical protein D7316_03695 [Gordonia insulae]
MPEGQEQARRLAKALADGRYGPVSRLVSSPMRRATQTAGFARESLSLELALDPRLVELSHGWPAYGIAEAYTDRRLLLDHMNAGRLGDNTFDVDRFRARVVDGIEALTDRDDDSATVIVCHGGVVNAYLSHVIGAPKTFFVDPFYTSVSRVLALPGGYREVLSLNEIDHLR